PFHRRASARPPNAGAHKRFVPRTTDGFLFLGFKGVPALFGPNVRSGYLRSSDDLPLRSRENPRIQRGGGRQTPGRRLRALVLGARGTLRSSLPPSPFPSGRR